MTRTARTVSGIFVLVALTFSMAETVWAAMCAPPGAAVMATVVESEHSMPGHGCPPAGELPGNDPSECPLGLFGGPQGCVAASLPALSPVLPQSWTGTTASVAAEPPRFVSTPSMAPFHPPRA